MSNGLDRIAPNAKLLGNCTREELERFSAFYRWLAENKNRLDDGPPESDCSEIVMMLFAAWQRHRDQ
jgi:hypothetical protein